jgi:hypothetical protein
MLLCEHVGTAPDNPRKVSIFGLLSTINAAQFPAHVGFCVYLVLTEGRGAGFGQVVISDGTTSEEIYRGELHRLKFDGDPLKVYAYSFRVVECHFPDAGPYWVEFEYEGVPISREILLVR